MSGPSLSGPSSERPAAGTALDEVRKQLADFVRERQWASFHDPKNLSMLLASEVGELLALLRWVPSAAADAAAQGPLRDALTQELGDVGVAWLLLCERVGVEPLDCISAKLDRNRANYPVEASRGRAERPTG